MFPVLLSVIRNERMLNTFYKYEFIWIHKFINIEAKRWNLQKYFSADV